MNFLPKPWQLLLLILAGWINRHQQDAIEYLLTENQVLRENLGKGRILFNDDQRQSVGRPRVRQADRRLGSSIRTREPNLGL